MAKEIKGEVTGKGLKFCIVASEFNDFITNRLLESAIDTFRKHQVEDQDITVVWTPGSFEIPAVVSKILKKDTFSAVLCLGAVIRGETPHFEYISSEVTKGIAKISLESSIPVVFGILTADTIEQAIQRAGAKGENRGKQSAYTALQMVNLYKAIL